MGRRRVSGALPITLLCTIALLIGACAGSPASDPPPFEAPTEVESDPAEAPREWSDAPWEAARRAGATFRAVGNEPGWLVTIYPDSLVYLAQYGTERYVFTDFVTRPGTPRVFEASARDRHFHFAVEDRPCRDDMSGQPFPATVTVAFGEDAYQGCGRSLD